MSILILTKIFIKITKVIKYLVCLHVDLVLVFIKCDISIIEKIYIKHGYDFMYNASTH